MWKRVAFGTPKNNEIVPQPLRNCSHQAKPKKAASGAHPKKQSPSRFCVQAIAGVQPQKSRNVAFGTPKNNVKTCCFWNPMKSCPSHCETAATRQSPRKLRRERIRKSRAPAGFAFQAIAGVQPQKSRNVAFGTPKTMWKRVAFGTPKNNEIVHQPLKLQPPGKAQESCVGSASEKRCVWNP